MANDYLDSAKKQFEYYKMIGERAMAQLSEHFANDFINLISPTICISIL